MEGQKGNSQELKLTSKSIMSQTNDQRPLQESIDYKKAMKKNETTYISQQHLTTELDAFSMLIFNIHDLKLVLHLFINFYM